MRQSEEVDFDTDLCMIHNRARPDLKQVCVQVALLPYLKSCSTEKQGMKWGSFSSSDKGTASKD